MFLRFTADETNLSGSIMVNLDKVLFIKADGTGSVLHLTEKIGNRFTIHVSESGAKLEADMATASIFTEIA